MLQRLGVLVFSGLDGDFRCPQGRAGGPRIANIHIGLYIAERRFGQNTTADKARWEGVTTKRIKPNRFRELVRIIDVSLAGP